MKILKRNGQLQDLSFDKITKRLRSLQNESPRLEHVDVDVLSQQVIARIFDGVSSSQIDELSSQLAISKSVEHPDYQDLASRIVISNLHKCTPVRFSECVSTLFGESLVNPEFAEIVRENSQALDGLIIDRNDYQYEYFGFKTLEKSYLLKNKAGVVLERPQYMLLRVAVAIHRGNLRAVADTYKMLSARYFTHASPTLFNAGTCREQLSSCFVLGIEDSMEGIYKCISDCAMISKYAGGIGVHISNIRGKGSKIHSTNGRSDGIVPMLRVFNATSVYSNQSGRRSGSFAVYLEPWHPDILDFIELPKKQGDETLRARDLFFGLWVPDLFMECVKADLDWYLLDPNVCPGLNETFGAEFEELYNGYVAAGKFVRKIKAREIWNAALTSQIESGMPYISYKDAVNRKSNQQNVGVIKSSNLCNEINIYSDNTEYACCNLASISLSSFVGENGNDFDYKTLERVTRQIVVNMNKIIDYNFYPVPETRVSNERHRPIGIGIQGVANLLYKLKIPFDSAEAKVLNSQIMETIYYSAISESCKLAQVFGRYSTFDGSPFSKGQFQFDLADVPMNDTRYNWTELKELVVQNGTRNALLTALMPTASTSNILGNYESFEPMHSNFFMRSVGSGDFPIINKYLVRDLMQLNLWSPEMSNEIVKGKGSIQGIEGIPQKLKDLYKTVYEISQKVLIDLSADRQLFIDQSQSLNVYIASPSISKLSSMHFYGWSRGLKTGLYYLRSEGGSAEQFTVKGTGTGVLACSLKNKDCAECSG